MMRTMPTNSPMIDVLNPSRTGLLLIASSRTGSMTQPSHRSERIDIVGDRDLAQQHLADDVGELDVLGEDRRVAGASGRQAPGDPGIVEPDANDKRRRSDSLGRHRRSRRLHLAGRDGLQNALDLSGIDLTPQKLERNRNGLTGFEISRADLGDCNSNDRI